MSFWSGFEKQGGVQKLLDKVVTKAKGNPISQYIAKKRLERMQTERLGRMFEHGTKGRKSSLWRAAAFTDQLGQAQHKLASDRKEVSTVALIHDGKMLMGKRRDNGKWTNPGGHLDPNEKPEDGAVREVKEEAGIDIEKNDLVHVRSENVVTPKGEKYLIHAYKVDLDKKAPTSMKEDPDAEVQRWSWLNIRNGLDQAVLANLHSPKNVLLKGLGLQKEARVSFRRFEREFKQAFGKVLEQGGQEYAKGDNR